MQGDRLEIRRDGKVMAWTEDRACFLDRKRRDELRKAGYKIYLAGKLWKEGKA